jgi:hypothetical protein
MGHEIKIGGSSFVVDDPNGVLARVEKHDQVVEHVENDSVEATVRAARERKMQAESMAKTVFPLANERPQMKILEVFVQGRMGRSGVILMWIATGIPCLLVAWGVFSGFLTHLHDTHVSPASICTLIAMEAICILWMGALLRNTLRAFSRNPSQGRGTP